MSTLCFITTCMGRLTHLRQTLGSVVAQSDSSVVVVDYSCPDACGDWVEATHPGVRVVREQGNTHYDQARSRNVGARAAVAEWLCFCDADILFDPSFALAVVPHLRPGHYYRPDRLDDWGTWGTFVCTRADFERVGGFDETYQGYGDVDLDLYDALEQVGVRRQDFPAVLLRHLPHTDDDRVRFYDNKNRWQNCSINRLYRIMKYDALRMQGQHLTAPMRENLYRVAIACVNTATNVGQLRPVNVEFGETELPGGWVVTRSLTFRYHRPAGPGSV